MGITGKEIVTISIPNGELDNDYTFFEDGKVRRNYDQSIYKPNLEAWLNAATLPNNDKEKILKACPAEYKSRIKTLLRK